MLWLKGKRPKKPRDWEKHVKNAKERVEQWAQGKLTVDDDEKAFDNLWGDKKVKVAFSRKQNRKCGYCETSIQADSDGGDIDHYRPKAAISKLHDDPAKQGKEIEGHNSRDPKHTRSTPKIFRGYHWLAYDWNNYLLACGTCNRKWKGTLFPVQGGHTQDPTETSRATEVPLLLDPYGDIDPAAHLEFADTGQVGPYEGSDIGRETINTLGLHCEGLRLLRYPSRQQAGIHIKALIAELRRKDNFDKVNLRRALQRVLEIGGAKRQYAGMVRALWAQKSPFDDLPWKKLRKLYNALR